MTTEKWKCVNGMWKMEKIVEDTYQSELEEKLKNYGWQVIPELWVRKGSRNFKVDIAAYHDFFPTLGWFTFELDLVSFGDLVGCHKKIVSKYVGSRFYDHRYPKLKNITPTCFVAVLPHYDFTRDWKDWWWAIRYFTQYGIGILRDECIWFSANGAAWSSVYLNPKDCRYGPDQHKLKKFLGGRLSF